MHVEDLHNGWIAPGILHRDLTVVNHLGRQGLHRISEIFLLCGPDVESGISGCGCFRSSERILAFLLLQNRELVKLGRVEDLLENRAISAAIRSRGLMHQPSVLSLARLVFFVSVSGSCVVSISGSCVVSVSEFCSSVCSEV